MYLDLPLFQTQLAISLLLFILHAYLKKFVSNVGLLNDMIKMNKTVSLLPAIIITILLIVRQFIRRRNTASHKIVAVGWQIFSATKQRQH